MPASQNVQYTMVFYTVWEKDRLPCIPQSIWGQIFCEALNQLGFEKFLVSVAFLYFETISGKYKTDHVTSSLSNPVL